ncbi:MAG TPA: hypothetical protein VM791_16865 [Vicinamibacterales bacterium]|jgi:hypothetical protein|nr:hypothetical protein [Vicinamibacterales bacterium]
MRIRNLLTAPTLSIVLLTSLTAGCGLDRKTILAPTGANLALSAPAGFAVVNDTVTIVVTASDADGRAVPDGTEVVLTAASGQLLQSKVRLTSGSASVPYKAGAQFGTTQIEARSGDAIATLDVPVASHPVARVEISSNPAQLPSSGGSAELTAQAFSSGGQAVAGMPIKFQTSAGTVTPAEAVITNAEGVATARLTASSQATVRASASAITREMVIAVRKAVVMDMTSNPVEPAAGQTVTFTVRATIDGQPAAGPIRVEFGDGQTANLGQVNGVGTTTHTYNAGGYNVTSVFTEGDGATVRHTIRLEVKGGSSPGPGPGPGIPAGNDAIDPNSITWLSPATTNVGGWRVTSTITSVDIRGDDICINHTKSGQWPLVSIDENPPNIEGNPVIIVNIGGRWYGAGFDWFGQGRTCKHMPAAEYGRDQIRVPPLDGSWPGPRSGDMIGLMVTTPSSDRIPVRSVNERSNIVLVRWP